MIPWKYGPEFGARRFNRPSWLKFLVRPREKESRAGRKRTETGCRSDKVSGFRSLPRGNVLWSIATLNQRKSCGDLGGFKRGEIELFQLIRLKLTRGTRLREMIETWFVHRPSPSPSFSLPYLSCRSCSCDFSSSTPFSSLERRLFRENIARNLSR